MDTVRVRVQCGAPSVARAAAALLAAEGIAGLFRGWLAPLLATGPRTIRACMHHQVDEAMLDRAIEAFGREVGVIAGGAA